MPVLHKNKGPGDFDFARPSSFSGLTTDNCKLTLVPRLSQCTGGIVNFGAGFSSLRDATICGTGGTGSRRGTSNLPRANSMAWSRLHT
jgi:hypothetical protein